MQYIYLVLYNVYNFWGTKVLYYGHKLKKKKVKTKQIKTSKTNKMLLSVKASLNSAATLKTPSGH